MRLPRQHLFWWHPPILLVCLVVGRLAYAAEYIQQESPPPVTAEDLNVSIDYAFTEAPSPDRSRLMNLKQFLEDKPEFWRNARVSLELRNYLFERRNSSDNKPEAYVIGGKLSFESGLWNNFGVKVSHYNSTKIDADGPDTGLLAPGQENINVLGEANLHYRFTDKFLEGSELSFYRQTLNLPFINKRDIRQVPSTHQGYLLSRKNSELDYVVGHLTKFKRFDSKDFIPMAQAAGAADSDKGVSVAGFRETFGDGITLGAANYFGWDTFNTFFAEGTYHAELTEKLDLRLSGQFTDQRSVGDNLVDDFDTHQIAAAAVFGWRGAIMTIAGSVVDNGSRIRKPWGGSPSYLSIQRHDFDRAGEKSVLFGLSYNTGFFSSAGVSSFINVARGWDARDPLTGALSPDRIEYDITVDYKPPTGFLEGLWIRARYNYIDIENDGDRVYDFRLIINYTLPIL
jgi:hypothetical protein